ncbi:alpha/beta fold hydrolase [Candidatus Woesearchaeota archaeon]|nr:alpha/beta fold hydrolase [Candidatus Woesearchaeota archaeon]
MGKRQVMIVLVLVILLSLLTACQNVPKVEYKVAIDKGTIAFEEKLDTETSESATVEKTDMSKVDIMLKTEDGIDIAATYYKPLVEEPKAAILLHMLNKDRFTWEPFAQKLQEKGYAVLSIDLRGHGESINQGKWQEFNDMDFKSMVNDAKVAKQYLKQTLGTKKYAIIGASIGANIALNYAAADSDIDAVVLLSPGETYRGVNVIGAINLYGERPVLLVASKEDDYAYKSSNKLNSLAQKPTFRKFEDAGHGTDMLAKIPGLDSLILTWLDENI